VDCRLRSGPQDYIITPGNAYAMFILKLDVNGDFIWAKSMDGSGVSNIDSGHGIALDATGNVYTVGTYTGTADFDTGSGTLNLSSTTPTYADVYIQNWTTTAIFCGQNHSEVSLGIMVMQ
jgi:hypothetical protein